MLGLHAEPVIRLMYHRTAVVMTALLSQITMRIVVSRNMPMTKTHTWLDEFQVRVRVRAIPGWTNSSLSAL